MPPKKLISTAAEKRRRMKRRRILQLYADGWTIAEIASDSKVKYTVQRVRQILAEFQQRYEANEA